MGLLALLFQSQVQSEISPITPSVIFCFAPLNIPPITLKNVIFDGSFLSLGLVLHYILACERPPEIVRLAVPVSLLADASSAIERSVLTLMVLS